MRRVTLSDIAVEVGVSANTVSRALNNRGEVSDETKARIASAAKRLGYTPDLLAKGLATNRTHAIGVVVPDQSNPFYAEVLRGVWRVAEMHNRTILLANAYGSEEREYKAVQSLLQRRVDGLILLTQNPAVTEEASSAVPCVVAGRHYLGDGVGVITADDCKGAYEAIQYLIEAGRKRILYLGCHDQAGPAHDRWQGYHKAHTAADLPFLKPISIEATMNAGYHFVRSSFTELQQYDAVFAFNDLIAIGLMRGLAEQGVKVPDDIAVMGYDDIEVAGFVSPTLTTVNIPKVEMGRWSAQFIIEQSQSDLAKTLKTVNILPTSLVKRQSA